VKLEIIAHRGYSARAPENTLAALDAALEAGATALEWDIQRSREGVPVVFHDDTLDRTTNGSGPVSDSSLADLSALDAGSWFAAEFSGEPIPTLAEALARVGQRAQRMYPEIKRGATAEEVDHIMRDVVDAGLLARTVFISMDWGALDQIRRESPESRLGYIVEAPERYAPAIEHVRGDPFALLDPDYRIVLALPELTRVVRDSGIELCVWTVNDPEEASRLADVGVTRFTTNEVSRLLEWRRRREDHEGL